MSYKLYYFPFPGRGEQVRLMLHVLGQTFEDVHVRRAEFAEMKTKGPAVLPFGSMPVLVDGDLTLAQGPVILGYLARKHGISPADIGQAARADSISLAAEDLRIKYFGLFGDDAEQKRPEFVEQVWKGRWLPNFEALLDINGDTGYFVGSSLSQADIAVWDVFHSVVTGVAGASLEGFPKLQAFYDRVRNLSTISNYLASKG